MCFKKKKRRKKRITPQVVPRILTYKVVLALYVPVLYLLLSPHTQSLVHVYVASHVPFCFAFFSLYRWRLYHALLKDMDG